jgi:hypothetical protein
MQMQTLNEKSPGVCHNDIWTLLYYELLSIMRLIFIMIVFNGTTTHRLLNRSRFDVKEAYVCQEREDHRIAAHLVINYKYADKFIFIPNTSYFFISYELQRICMSR